MKNVILYLNSTGRSKEAFQLVLKSGIQFEYVTAVSEIEDAVLVCGDFRYTGLSEIKRFLQSLSGPRSQSTAVA